MDFRGGSPRTFPRLATHEAETFSAALHNPEPKRVSNFIGAVRSISPLFFFSFLAAAELGHRASVLIVEQSTRGRQVGSGREAMFVSPLRLEPR